MREPQVERTPRVLITSLIATGDPGINAVRLGESALRRERQECVEGWVLPLDARVELTGQFSGRDFLRPESRPHRVNRPLRRRAHRSITFGTRKYGGLGSGAPLRTSSATSHGAGWSSRRAISSAADTPEST